MRRASKNSMENNVPISLNISEKKMAKQVSQCARPFPPPPHPPFQFPPCSQPQSTGFLWLEVWGHTKCKLPPIPYVLLFPLPIQEHPILQILEVNNCRISVARFVYKKQTWLWIPLLSHHPPPLQPSGPTGCPSYLPSLPSHLCHSIVLPSPSNARGFFWFLSTELIHKKKPLGKALG